MTPQQNIEQLKALREKATQGEWEPVEKYGSWEVLSQSKEPVFDDGSAGAEYSETCSYENRDYIVALHNSLPAIFDLITKLEKEAEAGRVLAGSLQDTRIDSFTMEKGVNKRYPVQQYDERVLNAVAVYHTSIKSAEQAGE